MQQYIYMETENKNNDTLKYILVRSAGSMAVLTPPWGDVLLGEMLALGSKHCTIK